MIDQTVIDWIKNGRVKGYSVKELHDLLLKQGHSKADVDEAIKISLPTESLKEDSELKKKKAKVKAKADIEKIKKDINFLPFIIAGSIIIGIALIGTVLLLLFGVSSENSSENTPALFTECGEFSKKIKSCVPFTCKFQHPLSADTMEREIIGLVDDKCVYSEKIPNGGRVDCNYTEDVRLAVSEYYKDLESVGTFTSNLAEKFKSEEEKMLKNTYTIGEKEVMNPLQEASELGQCVVSGYDDLTQSKVCPEGTSYEGETYTYEDGMQFAHLICSEVLSTVQPNGGYAAIHPNDGYAAINENQTA